LGVFLQGYTDYSLIKLVINFKWGLGWYFNPAYSIKLQNGKEYYELERDFHQSKLI
jgi:hypothetical protein